MQEFNFLKNSKKPVYDYISKLNEVDKKILKDYYIIAKKTIPETEEGMSYGMPAFLYRGKAISSCMVTENHYGYYPYGSAQIEELKDELKEYDISSGTIRFPLGKKLPLRLISKLLKYRAALVDEKLKDKNGPLPKTSAPAKRALDLVKVKNLKGLTKFTKKEISNLHGMGPKAISILEKAMKAEGFRFKDH